MKRIAQRVIGFAGAPSVGKSTLARAVMNHFGLEGLAAEFVSEYARSYIQRFGSIVAPYEQLLIFDEQRQMEDEAFAAGCNLIIAETPTFVSYAYAMHLSGKSAKDRVLLSSLYSKVLDRISVYDVVYYVPLRLPMTIDGVRIETESDRQSIDRILRAFLELHVPDYITIESDSFDERLSQVISYERARMPQQKEKLR